MEAGGFLRINSGNYIGVDLMEFKLALNNPAANRQGPLSNGLNLTTNEYREFLEDFSFTCSEFKKWLNSVYFRGRNIRLPFRAEQLDLDLKFENEKVHFMVDVKDLFY